jgi:hypothetical protein
MLFSLGLLSGCQLAGARPQFPKPSGNFEVSCSGIQSLPAWSKNQATRE